MGPVLDQVSSDMEGKVAIYKVNIDKSRDLSQQYEIQGVPTLILFSNGKEKDRLVGFRDKNAIENFISANR
jgi:thioredoxin 1